MIAFLNFVTGLIVYCIVYPEEADVCAEVEYVFKDLEVLVAKERGQEVVDSGKKKRKAQLQISYRKYDYVYMDVWI